ncbi:MAG TPA: hypothetical protein VII24_02270 [Pseudolabrys sp.]|jgi:hypothetical protein
MKKLLIAVTLATLAASSAFAKTPRSQSSADAIAADSYTVIAYGRVVGRDPDPNVRLELMRDAGLLGD